MNTILTILLISNQIALASNLEVAKLMAAKNNYKGAAQEFLAASAEQNFIPGRYGLGISLLKLKLPYLASIPLMTAATEGTGRIQKKALDQLIKISYDTNDSSILNYSIKKLKPEDLEVTSMEVYETQLTEYHIEKGDFDEAIKSSNQILLKNPNNERALFLAGLANLKKNDPSKASEHFKRLSVLNEKKMALSATQGLSQANYGRSLYQEKNFVAAEKVYRKIPKDHALYRKVQMELAWTLFRMGKIRSSLSVIQTLHTPYYENFYDPESFILRTIILLFACQSNEALRAAEAFENNFIGVKDQLSNWVLSQPNVETTIKEIETAEKNKSKLAVRNFAKSKIPFFVVRTLMDEDPLRGLLKSKTEILSERQQFQRKFEDITGLPLYQYSLRAYTARLKNADKNIAIVFNKKIKITLQNFRDLEAQIDFLKFEILEEKKRASKSNLKISKIIDENRIRSFYTQNGYRYWPFNGEYWVDEIGNYQYLGVNRCEN
jgi:tetratricopeptide (TPR) repeat protein